MWGEESFQLKARSCNTPQNKTSGTLGRKFTKGHFTHETESPWPLHFNHSHWWKRWSRSKFASHYAWGTNGVYMWMQDGWRVYLDSYMASSGSCFMVTWTIFNNLFLEVGLTQNWDMMALQTFTTVDLFYFVMCEDPHEENFIEIAFGWGRGHIWLHNTLESPWSHYMILDVSWDGLWTLSFELSQIHGHGSWLVCEVALRACPREAPKHGRQTYGEPPNGSGGRVTKSFTVVWAKCHDNPNDMHSLNDYNFILFGLSTEVLGILGLFIYYWKFLENTFPRCITWPRIFQITVITRTNKQKFAVV